MPGTTWVIVERFRDQISDVSYELLALARELGGPVEAVVLGPGSAALAPLLGAADRILCVEHEALIEPVPETQAQAVAQLAAARRPAAILLPLTNVSMGVATLIAARLGAPCVNFTSDLQWAGGRLTARCLLYGGKIEADVAPQAEPAVFGIFPGARPAETGRVTAQRPIEQLGVELSPPAIRFKRYVEPEAGDVNLAEQSVLVAVGRGIQSKENLELAQALAEALGGAVCGSRPVIDQGWLPLSRQVGKSGLTVKPRLYIAAGISGAPEHVEGMKNADLIVAINSDPGAPIFNVAHYGVVGDALDLLPALADGLRARKG